MLIRIADKLQAATLRRVAPRSYFATASRYLFARADVVHTSVANCENHHLTQLHEHATAFTGEKLDAKSTVPALDGTGAFMARPVRVRTTNTAVRCRE